MGALVKFPTRPIRAWYVWERNDWWYASLSGWPDAGLTIGEVRDCASRRFLLDGLTPPRQRRGLPIVVPSDFNGSVA